VIMLGREADVKQVESMAAILGMGL
jgi:hypothetical protein